jgi:hypothetical protein
MKKLIFCLMALCLFVATSCEGTKEAPAVQTTFELTSADKLRVATQGGDFEITYSLENPVEGTDVKATVVNAAMITSVDTAISGVVKITISENTTGDAREGAVVVSYGALSFTVVVEQEYSLVEQPAEKIEIVANQLVGNYYGDNIAEGLGHYWVILTKDGFVDGSAIVGGEYFRFDLLAPMIEDGAELKIPDGDYTFDLTMHFKPYTIIDLGNTDFSWVDENMEGWAQPLEDASLSVKGNHIELTALVNNKEYHVVFDGDYTLTRSVITEYVSSLTKDTVIDVSNCVASVSNFGDYWGCGCNNWQVEFVCVDGFKYGTYVVIDFLSSSTTDFTGRYVASGFSAEDATKPDFRAGVFVPGFRVSSDSDLLLGSLYMEYRDGLCVSQAPLYDGTITIEANGDGTHTIKIDALDDAPKQNKITLNWTGRL